MRFFPERETMDRSDYVLICGDFGGLWSGTTLDDMSLDWLEALPFTTLFADGNHENYDLLYKLPVERWNGGKVHRLRPHVLHLMRGQVFNIDGHTFFTMGGASSHDVQDGILDRDDPEFDLKYYYLCREHARFRINHESWWKEELPSDEEYAEARENLARANYQAKYALSEILICGECGSPYRRQTYMPKGEKIYVWRCLNRMENGKRICKNSPTFKEEVLHKAIIAAMNEMFSQQAARDVLRESVATALASKQPKMSLPAIENRMRELKARQDELVTLVSCGDATFEAVETEFSKIGEEWNDLKLLHTKLELEQPSSSEIDRRMEQITSTIEQMDATITDYDDIRTRQLISTIKVLDKETLQIRFKDGMEIVQRVEK